MTFCPVLRRRFFNVISAECDDSDTLPAKEETPLAILLISFERQLRQAATIDVESKN